MVCGEVYYWGMTKIRIPTQEMLDDLSKMRDKEYMEKWGVSRIVPIKLRRRHKIKSFLPQYNAKRRVVDGVEYKWCPREGGHWSVLSEFKPSPTRAGGYRGICIMHERNDGRNSYHTNSGKEKARAWRKTPNAKNSLRNTWRKQKAIKNNALVKWDREDEERAYKIFDGCCGYCGIKVSFRKIEFDHFYPLSKGGKTEPKNMIPCCSVCNHGVGGKFDKDPEKWIFARFHPEYAKLMAFIYLTHKAKQHG